MSRGTIFTEALEQQYVTEVCCQCSVRFAMTKEFYEQQRRRATKGEFFCPNGHPQQYTGTSDRERIAQLEAEKTALQARVNTAERACDRAKAEAKRMEKRAAAGVCPYCDRSFATERLQRHIHTKHPDKAHASE